MSEEKSKTNATALELMALDTERNLEIRRFNRNFNEKLEQFGIRSAIDWWKRDLESEAGRNLDIISSRHTHLVELFKLEIIDPSWSVEQFNHQHSAMLHGLRESQFLSEEEKELKLDALVAFTSFLRKKSNESFPLLQTPAELNFQMTVRRAAPKTLDISEWIKFRTALEKLSLRDSLVAKLMSYTARGLSEILELTLDSLDFSNNLRIRLKNERNEDVWLQLDSSVAEQLQQYIDESQEYRDRSNPIVFITKKGKPVFRTHFKKVFNKASEEAQLGFRVTNTMIQWSQVVDWLRSVGASKQQIMKKLHLKNIPRNLET